MGSNDGFFVLRWNDFQTNFVSSFQEMRGDGDFLDATVACDEDHQLQAHKVVLSASSPFFKSMLRNNPAQHPVLVMPPDIKFQDLVRVFEFIYCGEVSVSEDDLESFMKAVKILKVKGLTEETAPPKEVKVEPKTPQKTLPRLPANTKVVRRRSGSMSSEVPPKRMRDFDNDDYQDYAGYQDNYGGIQLKGLVCPIEACKVMCQNVPTLKDHMISAHGIPKDEDQKQPRKRPPAAVGETEPVFCEFCDKAFKNKKSLFAHQRRLHKHELGIDVEEEYDYGAVSKRGKGRGRGKRSQPLAMVGMASPMEEDMLDESYYEEEPKMESAPPAKPVGEVQPAPRHKSPDHSPPRPTPRPRPSGSSPRKAGPKDLQSKLGLKFGNQISITSSEKSGQKRPEFQQQLPGHLLPGVSVTKTARRPVAAPPSAPRPSPGPKPKTPRLKEDEKIKEEASSDYAEDELGDEEDEEFEYGQEEEAGEYFPEDEEDYNAMRSGGNVDGSYDEYVEQQQDN